jgi:hypothetical protein
MMARIVTENDLNHDRGRISHKDMLPQEHASSSRHWKQYAPGKKRNEPLHYTIEGYDEVFDKSPDHAFDGGSLDDDDASCSRRQ